MKMLIFYENKINDYALLIACFAIFFIQFLLFFFFIITKFKLLVERFLSWKKSMISDINCFNVECL